MERVETIPVEGLKDKFVSKKDIYRRLTIDLQYYLPSYRKCTVFFIKQILNNTKKAFKKLRVETTYVPYYKELSVKYIYPKLKTNKTINQYLPDYEKDQLPEREFFYNIVSTLYPGELNRVIYIARKNRALDFIQKDEEMVKITADIRDEIEKLMLFPTTPGKAIHLLKKKTKKAKERKEPFVYPVELDELLKISEPKRTRERKQRYPLKNAAKIPEAIMEDVSRANEDDEEEKKAKD